MWSCAIPDSLNIHFFRIDSKAGLVVSSSDSAVFISNLYPGAHLRKLDHANVRVLDIHSDLRRVVTTSDCTAKVWDLDSGEPLDRPSKIHLEGDITTMMIDQLTGKVFLGHESGAVRVFSLGNSSKKRPRQEITAANGSLFRFLAHPTEVMLLVVEPISHTLVTSAMESVAIWDTTTFELRGRIVASTLMYLVQCDSKTGRMVCASESVIQLWDLASLTRYSLERDSSFSLLQILGLRLTSGFVVAMQSRSIDVWCQRSGTHLHTLSAPSFLASITADLESSLLFANSTDGKIFAWYLTSGRTCWTLDLEVNPQPQSYAPMGLLGLNSKCIVVSAWCHLIVVSFATHNETVEGKLSVNS